MVVLSSKQLNLIKNGHLHNWLCFIFVLFWREKFKCQFLIVIYVKITTYCANATIISRGNENHRFGSDLLHYCVFIFKIFPCVSLEGWGELRKWEEKLVRWKIFKQWMAKYFHGTLPENTSIIFLKNDLFSVVGWWKWDLLKGQSGESKETW